MERQIGLQRGLIEFFLAKQASALDEFLGKGWARAGRNPEPERALPEKPSSHSEICRLANNPADRQSRLALVCMLVGALHLVQHLEKMKSHLKV